MMRYGIQIYLDNRKKDGTTWPLNWSPFANEAEAVAACIAKGITYGRVMLVAPNIAKDGGFAKYKAYDGRLVTDHLAEWAAMGIQPVLALRDYESLSIPTRTDMLVSIYRTCRIVGFKPVLTLGNEPDDKLPDGSRRYSPEELGACASLVIPLLRAEYPDLEWWGPDTATAGWYATYQAKIAAYAPTLTCAHTYDGGATATTPLSTEVTNALAKVSGFKGMTEWTPYSKTVPVDSSAYVSELKRYYDTLKSKGITTIFFWVLNAESGAFKDKSTMRPAFEYAMSLNAPVILKTVLSVASTAGTLGPSASVTVTLSDGSKVTVP